MNAAFELQAAVLNPSLWKKIIGSVPIANVVTELSSFYEAAALNSAVNKKRWDNKKIALANGEDPTQTRAREREQENQDYKDNTDYHNEQKKIQFDYEQEQRKLANEARDEVERKIRNDNADFHAAERAKERELERLDRIAIAEFWISYSKNKKKALDDSRPSKLNFGLI